nr:MAG TPA: hypothetical protein [Caudoviricetes sp.]
MSLLRVAGLITFQSEASVIGRKAITQYRPWFRIVFHRGFNKTKNTKTK